MLRNQIAHLPELCVGCFLVHGLGGVEGATLVRCEEDGAISNLVDLLDVELRAVE